jgi:conflict system pore-forming effector with SLATT domain
MTSLETVALDYQRWWSTALGVKGSNHARFTLMVELTLAAAVLEALALQLHASYQAASQIAAYGGVLALVLVLVIRARGLSRERVQAWVLAAAAAHSLKSEMYQYRTSCGSYADRFDRDPDLKLLQRRDEIVERVRSIQKYVVEPNAETNAPLGSLDAEAYISERVNDEITKFQQFTRNLNNIQGSWLRKEYLLLVGGTLLAVILAVNNNLTYGAWIGVIANLSLASGVTAKSERYATLLVECKAMPERLTGILEQWRASHGTLDQLVEQVEGLVLAQAQAWILGASDFRDVAVPESQSICT